MSERRIQCKKIYEIPGLLFTKPSWDWNCMGTLFPARESLVSDIPAGDGKIATLFLQCRKGEGE